MFYNVKKRLMNYLFSQMQVLQKRQERNELESLKKQFKSIGKSFSLGKNYSVKGSKYIEIGSNFSALERFRIEAWDKYGNQNFLPSVKIGDNVIFNTDIHIGCIDKIEIGDDCLFASRIYITDHSHGDTSQGMITAKPLERPLLSKGAVIIENNVWVGEGVVIMSGVTIGKNSIIGANSVVTKNIPSNSVVVGVPGRVIKKLV